MAKARQSQTIGSTAFPLYSVRMVGDRYFIVAGGGGQAKTGIPNAMEMYALKRDQGMCVAEKVCAYDTGSEPVMNSTTAAEGNSYTLATGQGDSCHLYKMSYKVVTPEKEAQATERIRKRKGNTDSDAHTGTEKQITFDVQPTRHVQTDFHKDGGFQKAVQITRDLSVMVTGGADGKLRVWKYATFEKLYEVKAHTNEIDDLDISPAGDKITTVSRDNHAYVWFMKDGKKFLELDWKQNTEGKYRYRGCRYGDVVDKSGESRLYTISIPSTRGPKAAQCYLTKWETTAYQPKIIMSTGTEILSSLAVSDEGTYVGVGTISGSVSIYIAFSLQRLYHIKESHGIFVTGLEFTSSSPSCRAITGDYDSTLLSVSADKQIKIHQVAPRAMYSALWVIAGFILMVYMAFWFISAFGL